MQEETTLQPEDSTPARTWGTPAPRAEAPPAVGAAPVFLPVGPIVPENEAEQLARQEEAELALPEAERANLLAERAAARAEAEKIAREEAIKAPTPEALEVRLDELEDRLEALEVETPLDLAGKPIDITARRAARDLRTAKRTEEASK